MPGWSTVTPRLALFGLVGALTGCQGGATPIGDSWWPLGVLTVVVLAGALAWMIYRRTARAARDNRQERREERRDDRKG